MSFWKEDSPFKKGERVHLWQWIFFWSFRDRWFMLKKSANKVNQPSKGRRGGGRKIHGTFTWTRSYRPNKSHIWTLLCMSYLDWHFFQMPVERKDLHICQKPSLNTNFKLLLFYLNEKRNLAIYISIYHRTKYELYVHDSIIFSRILECKNIKK